MVLLLEITERGRLTHTEREKEYLCVSVCDSEITSAGEGDG